jgi:hypothetical protein
MKGVVVKVAAAPAVAGRFDSQVLFKGRPSTSVENGFLLLRQRVNLYRFEGDEWWEVDQGKKVSYACQPWSDEEWRKFLFVFRFICEDYWVRQHPVWLEPPASFTALNVPFARPTHRPNFQSAYEMDIRDFKRNPHHDPHMSVNVLRLKDDVPGFRSYVNRSAGQAALTNRDIDESNYVHWWGPFMLDSHVQVTAVHENWHMLGGDHVGTRLRYPECRKHPNEGICYGKTALDRGELAGEGLRWAPAYDEPWRERIALHTDTDPDDWGASPRSVPPRRVGA